MPGVLHSCLGILVSEFSLCTLDLAPFLTLFRDMQSHIVSPISIMLSRALWFPDCWCICSSSSRANSQHQSGRYLRHRRCNGRNLASNQLEKAAQKNGGTFRQNLTVREYCL